MADLSCDSIELSMLATIIAIAISEDKTLDELNILGNLITSVGSIIVTIAAVEQSQASQKTNGSNQNNG
ncbi:hypothetical protein [Clostridium lundense]|uniref:hypothetical protein n=1 Tax=Clostridium lundense TaxID=319475 RepID=UPI000483EC2F|nr:hypothetical protein [Clostridium lundense]